MPSVPRAALVGLLATVLSLATAFVGLTPQEAQAAPAIQTPTTCAPAVALTDGGFEAPVIGSGYQIMPQANVPGWSTTAADGAIELWASGFNGVPSATGNQFAELNANQVSTLYQDVATTPGQVLRWQLQHRGRSGVDVMSVLLGPPSGPLVAQGAPISDGNTAWGTYSGMYTVPAGQTTTRFAFQSVSSTGGVSFGNFLDSISLGTAACVITTKSVTNTSRPGTDAVAGDILEYTVQVTNGGGVPATMAVVSDAVPAGTTFVPGSIVTTTGAVTDAPGDDSGEHSAGTVQVRVGDGANAATGGSIPAGESRTMRFRATVNPAAAGLTVVNEATVSFVESLSGTPSTSTSNSTGTPVLLSADLQVVQTLDTVLSNGGPAQYTITVTNNGPQSSPGTELTSTLPLPGMTVNDPDCAITLSQLVCGFGTLLQSQSRVVVVTGTVPGNAAGGTTYQLVSAVAGTVHDPILINNSATTPGTVTNLPGLTIAMTITNTTGAAGAPAHEGDPLQATYVVTSTGNVDLTTLTVTDPVFGAVTCTPTSLTPGGTATCSANTLYRVTATDVSNGTVASVATAQANSAALGGGTVSDDDAAAIAAAAAPGTIALTGSSPLSAIVLAMVLLLLGVSALGFARTRGPRPQVR